MEPHETLSSEIEGVNGEEDQLEVQTNIISSDSGTRMSCKEKVKSMNSDKHQVPSTVTPDSCAFGEASTEVGQTISKATSHVLAGPALPQPQLQGAWTKPLLITGATDCSTMLSNNPVTENSEWPALSTRDIGRKKNKSSVDITKGKDSFEKDLLNPRQKVWNGNCNPRLADEEIEDVETVGDYGRSDFLPL
ncbi:hypothetical protein Bca101_051645 [Brassica carinata]